MRTLPLVLLLASSLSAQDLRVVRPQEIADVLVNPGIGFTTLNRFNGDSLNEGTKWTEGYPVQDYPIRASLEVKGQPMTSIAYLRIYWKCARRARWPSRAGGRTRVSPPATGSSPWRSA